MNHEGTRNEWSGSSMSRDKEREGMNREIRCRRKCECCVKCLHLHLKIKRGMKHEMVKLTKKREGKD